jgi:hypothetical protein
MTCIPVSTRWLKASCSWLAVDYDAGLGVCSACPDDLVRWNAGDRAIAVPMEVNVVWA